MASQHDISVRAGVSQSLVSRVLNGRAAEFGITAETAARVLAVAAELGYRPNPAASMLLGGASRLIGVAVRSFADPFLAAILQELNRGALAAGRTLLVAGLDGDAAQRVETIRQIQRYRPDALIVVGTTDFSAWDDTVIPPGQPVVQIGFPTSDPRVLSCGIDETAAAAALMCHLHEASRTNIAVIGDQSVASADRACLLTIAGKLHHIPLPTRNVFLSKRLDHEAGEDGADWLIANWSGAERPDAVIATGDLIALGLLRALATKGISVPAELALASYDDLPIAALTRPTLTTIRQPAPELAAAAMAVVTGASPRTNVLLPGVLIVRESTRWAPKIP